MPKSSNQKLKIMYIARFLENETDEDHGITVKEIIEKLDRLGISAERKSIYDDINALKDFGMDIGSYKKGNSTYYCLLSREFELAELKLLVDSVQGSRFITLSKSNALIRRIEGLCSQEQAKELHRQVYVSNRIKAMNESIFYAVDDIHRAINRNMMISFQYAKWNIRKEKELRHDGKKYEVSPWALTWDDENYYLICYDKNEDKIKHFRVDKMVKLKVLDRRREGEKLFRNFDMGIYSKRTFGMFGGEEVTVRLLCESDMIDPIIDRFGQDVIIIPAEDERFRVNANVKLSPVFLTWIMNFGGKIKIEGPEKVKEEFRRLATAAVESVR